MTDVSLTDVTDESLTTFADGSLTNLTDYDLNNFAQDNKILKRKSILKYKDYDSKENFGILNFKLSDR